MSLDLLFSPLQVGNLRLPNRFIMAAMQRGFAPDGVIPADAFAAYFSKRAEAGVGLVLTEMASVNRPVSYADPSGVRFWGEQSLGAWRQVVNTVHDAGGLIGLQIGHVGATAHPLTGWRPEGVIDSPSGIDNDGKAAGEPMTESAIAETIAAFADAAADAQALGFDAIEIHGGHGGLIDQFAWHATNRRNDYWGGDMAGRARFGAEVVRAVRDATGPGFPIIVRLSQWKIGHYAVKVAPTPADLAAWVEPMAAAGADAFHGSQRRFWEPEFAGSNLNFAGWLKKLSGKPSITVGSVGLSGEFMGAFAGEISTPASIEGLYERVAKDEFDLIAVGRALLSDPQWLEKIRTGRLGDLQPFTPTALETLW